jgi:hypothetical protein
MPRWPVIHRSISSTLMDASRQSRRVRAGQVAGVHHLRWPHVVQRDVNAGARHRRAFSLRAQRGRVALSIGIRRTAVVEIGSR